MSAGRLLELSVSGLALIDRLRLTLDPGLNVITGETGAGKSLVIDALGLVLGARADPGLIRHGAESARVEALFDRLPEPLIAVREVATGGRSTARLDDLATTASRLADEVGPLVEIHGQHDQQRLLDERRQRDLLDAFGGNGEARAAMADVVERWRANRAALAELAIDPRELARRVDLLEHEAAEIATGRLRPGEADEIRARLSAAQRGEAIARGAAAVHEALASDEVGARESTAAAFRTGNVNTIVGTNQVGHAISFVGITVRFTGTRLPTLRRRIGVCMEHAHYDVSEYMRRVGKIDFRLIAGCRSPHGDFAA